MLALACLKRSRRFGCSRCKFAATVVSASSSSVEAGMSSRVLRRLGDVADLRRCTPASARGVGGASSVFSVGVRTYNAAVSERARFMFEARPTFALTFFSDVADDLRLTDAFRDTLTALGALFSATADILIVQERLRSSVDGVA